MCGNQEERRYIVELNSVCTRTSMNMLLIRQYAYICNEISYLLGLHRLSELMNLRF